MTNSHRRNLISSMKVNGVRPSKDFELKVANAFKHLLSEMKKPDIMVFGEPFGVKDEMGLVISFQ